MSVPNEEGVRPCILTSEAIETLGNIDSLSCLVNLDVLDRVVGNESSVVFTGVTLLLSELESRLVSRARNLGNEGESRVGLETRRKLGRGARARDDERSSERVDLKRGEVS